MKSQLKNENLIWTKNPSSDAIWKNIEQILGAVNRLPLQYWKPNMFFVGAQDKTLSELTQGRFPAKQSKRKTHPVFSLEQLPLKTGFKVCPCSSKPPSQQNRCRYIKKGCRLIYTGHLMDRNSYLVEKVVFNIPSSVAHRMRFRGRVPEECLKYHNHDS